MDERMAALERQVAALREAVQPFARIYELNVPLWGPDHADDDDASLYIPDTAVKWGELRCAAVALTAQKGPDHAG
jgi:hypothetical protein